MATSSGVTGALRRYAAWKIRGSQTTSSAEAAASDPSRTLRLGFLDRVLANRVTAGATR
jgi:hypothetical protein